MAATHRETGVCGMPMKKGIFLKGFFLPTRSGIIVLRIHELTAGNSIIYGEVSKNYIDN
jgi:hypothetical protein